MSPRIWREGSSACTARLWENPQHFAGACFVCTESGRILGYGVLEYSFYEQGFISMVYAAGDQRRQGIGAALCSALEEHCTTPKLFTSTNQTNVPMQLLLQKRGYVESGIIFNLDPGDPELIHFKRLRQDVA
jgi:ribosomal protein S18 acetylase RimI-like enzyme